MSKLPPALNLTVVQKALQASGQFGELEKKIRVALTTQSCFGDVREAADCIDTIDFARAGRNSLKEAQRDTAEMALLSTAVSLYVRATSTQAQRRPAQERERGPSQIAEAIPTELVVDHDALLDVRSKALAHVYFDQDVGGTEWHSGAVLAVRTASGWIPTAASRRTRFDVETMARLRRLLPVVMSILRTRVIQRLDDLAEALEKYKSPELTALFSDCMLDPLAFFGTRENAERALLGVARGAHTTFNSPTSPRQT